MQSIQWYKVAFVIILNHCGKPSSKWSNWAFGWIRLLSTINTETNVTGLFMMVEKGIF